MSSDPEEPGPVELSGITLVCEFRHLSSWVTMNLSQTGAAPCWLPVLHWGEFSPLPGHWELGNLISQHPGHQGISEKYLRISEKTLALLVGWGSMAASAIHVKGLMEVNRAFQSCKKLILEQQKYSVNIADWWEKGWKENLLENLSHSHFSHLQLCSILDYCLLGQSSWLEAARSFFWMLVR